MPAGIFTCSRITFSIVYYFYFLCVVPHGINVIVFGKEMGKGTESYDLFWYCLRDAVNADKIISSAIIVYDKFTTILWQYIIFLFWLVYLSSKQESSDFSPSLPKDYYVHSSWNQNTEKRNNVISQMQLRSVFKMRVSILNTATTEQMGYGIISFFVCFLLNELNSKLIFFYCFFSKSIVKWLGQFLTSFLGSVGRATHS